MAIGIATAVHVALFAIGCMQYRDDVLLHPMLAKYMHLGNSLCWATAVNGMFALSPVMASVIACSTLPAVLLTGSFHAALRVITNAPPPPIATGVVTENAQTPMFQAMVGFPALAGIVVVAVRILSSYALPASLLSNTLPHASVSLALIAAQVLMAITGLATCLIFPAPIVADLLMGPTQMSNEADRLWSMKDVDTDRVALRLSVPSIPSTAKMSDFYDFSNLRKMRSGMTFALPEPIDEPALARFSKLDVAVILKVAGRSLATGEPAPKTNRWVVYFGGNGEVLEGSWNGGLSIAHTLNANLIMYNPRGVGSSTGVIRSADSLLQDARSVTEYVANLIEAKRWGAPPSTNVLISKEGRGKSFFTNLAIEKNFMLFGHSIGGAIAAHISAEYLPNAPLVLDRTFSTLVDAAKSLSPIPVPALVEFAIPIIFGDLDVVGAWNKLARSSPQNLRNRIIIFTNSDEVIKYYTCSIARHAGTSVLRGAEDRTLKISARDIPSFHNSQLWAFDNADIIRRHIVDLFPPQ